MSGSNSAQRSLRTSALAIGLLHLAGWGLLTFTVLQQPATGAGLFGVGIGVTAYALGLRHAFDADHIAAIDNTTRRLLGDGKPAGSTGFWFALGHSAMVLALVVLVALGVHLTSALMDEGSHLQTTLGTIGTSVAGTFLLGIAALNLVALTRILQMWRRTRSGHHNEPELEAILAERGLVNRLLRGVFGAVRHPRQMFALGLLFGLGFDTATEVTLLVLAGNGVADGLPWYAIGSVPLLFAAGMTMLDTLNGAFMASAYRWAFTEPARRLYYNAVVTGLSAAMALAIGGIELIGMLHDNIGLTDPVTTWISELDLGNIGFALAALFVLVWGLAVAYWRLSAAEHGLAPESAPASLMRTGATSQHRKHS